MDFRCLVRVLIAFGLILHTGAATAGKKDNSIRFAYEQIIENIDPYFNSVRGGVILGYQIWDNLIYRDPRTNEYKGQLATTWRWIDERTLELELRKGVKFHNGSDFDADDVVYTLNFVAKPENKVTNQQVISWIERVEKLDQYKVRIVAKEPFPAALEYLASARLVIHPHEYYARVGPKGMNEKPIGSGPYRVTEHLIGKHVRLARNPDYFRDSPRPGATVEKVEIRFIPDRQTQVAEVFAGGIDMMINIPADQAQQMRGAGNLQVVFGDTMRIMFLQLATSERAAASPLRDVRVRKAILHSIDRPAMIKSIVGEGATLLHSVCYPSQFG